MSLSLNFESDESLEKDVKCHHLPCKISLCGKSNVSMYFSPFIREVESSLKCSLRGRPLDGQILGIPKGYKGIILKENKKPLTDEIDRELTMEGAFNSFTYWNFDIKPSNEDKLVKALQWIKIAKVLHEPIVNSEDVNKKNTTPKKSHKRKHSSSDE